MALSNWAENHTYRAQTVHTPSALEQLQEIVARARRIQVLGSRHTFSAIGDADELVSLARLAPDVVIDRAASSVGVGGAMRYGELAEGSRPSGLALANLASLPHISVAGAMSTATHGSGAATAIRDGGRRARAGSASDGELIMVRAGRA